MRFPFRALMVTTLVFTQQSVNAGPSSWFKSCEKECVQEKVCKDSKVAEWCKKNCSLKADSNGRIFNGVCFEVLTQNAQQNATQVTTESVNKIVETCKKKVQEIQYYPQQLIKTFPEKKAELKALLNLNSQATHSIKAMEKPFNSFNIATMSSSELTKFGFDLSAYEVTCRRLTDSVLDFTYWAKGLIPQGGYKTLRPGTTKVDADKIFQATRDANIK